MKEWTFIKHLILSVIIVILSILGRSIVPVIFSIVSYFKVNKSSAIIGGADGPTKVFVTTNIQENLIIQYIIIFIILLILYIPIKILLKKRLSKKN